MYRKIFFLLIILLFTMFTEVLAYDVEITGKFETGERLYDDLDEIIDRYFFDRYWIKYKKKLNRDIYYYIKTQYYKKEYDKQLSYTNQSFSLWALYSKNISEKLKNKWSLNLKDKDYFYALEKNYKAGKLAYQLVYDFNDRQRYKLDLQKQRYFYEISGDKDYNNQKIVLSWQYDISSNLEIESSFKFEEQIFLNPVNSSNKHAKIMGLSFKYKL